VNDATLETLRMTSSKISGDGDRERLEGDLGGMEGVRTVKVDPDNHSLEVTYDSVIVDANQIRSAVTNGGFLLDPPTSDTDDGNAADLDLGLPTMR
jgi:copper chaperone CopZ